MIRSFVSLLFLIPTISFAQQKKAFKISGHSTFYNNKKILIQGGVLSELVDFNDFKFANPTVGKPQSFCVVEVKNNEFNVTGIQKYPHPFQFQFYDDDSSRGTSSYIFFVDDSSPNIELGNLFEVKNLGTRFKSKSNIEYQYLRKLYSKYEDTATGKIFDMQAKQKILHTYISKHPDSYVALWDMVIDYIYNPRVRNDLNRKSILENTQLFSAKIKKTKTYTALVNLMQQELELNTAETFPNIPLNETDSLYPIVAKNKFTLVDFWFSGCHPCLAQFPLYKNFYETYKQNGFEIIGISCDRKSNEAEWKKISGNFNWQQYLDTNGVITNKLYIEKFPTSFLLDNTGKIIRKDISPADLEAFLKKELKEK
jgi:thiol-disulfide isomerase/thioredoxin